MVLRKHAAGFCARSLCARACVPACPAHGTSGSQHLTPRALQACNAGAHARETEQEHDEITVLSRISDASHLDWILYRDAERRFMEYVHRAVQLPAERLVAYMSTYGTTECSEGTLDDAAASNISGAGA